MTFDYSVQNIIDGQGIPIVITGMVIVFFALTLISLFIAALPRILERIAQRWPEPEGHHHSAPAAAQAGVTDDVVAAIAVALHRRRARG
ncbi:MAG: hypothetical protein CME19_03920 [Gemmatimonadetes bacterium]|nr:hypothetical protein [Gemmatimonadota bacterium]